MRTELKRLLATGGVMALALTAVAAAQDRDIILSPFDGGAPLTMKGEPAAPGGVLDGYGLHGAADWIVADRCANNGWSWPSGTNCPLTYNNLTGPIAMGLLAAYDITGNAAHLQAAIDGGDYDLTFQYGNGEPRFGSFAPAFLHTLSGAAYANDPVYSNHAATGFFDALTAGTYGDPTDMDTVGYLDGHKAARSGSLINIRPWDMQYMPWVAGQIGNATSGPADPTSQQARFLEAVLDGLNTLDSDQESCGDILGLAGGLHGLALNGTTTFASIATTNFAAIDGIDNLCDLADALVSFQNPNGSWYWESDIASPVAGDEDTQTTAYCVLALKAAQAQGCGPYDAEIELAREWLFSMQAGNGSFATNPGATVVYTETCGEATSAVAGYSTMAISTDTCENSGTVTVTIDMSDQVTYIAGGQFFLWYDNTVLDFVSMDPGDGVNVFEVEIYETVDEPAGTIDYSVGVVFPPGIGTMDASTLATITFSMIDEVCDTAGLIQWRSHTPPSRLSDLLMNPITPELSDLPAVTLDATDPVITCPSNITVNADAGYCDATLTITPATATDNCDPAPVVTYERSDNPALTLADPFPVGTTTVTWTATDECGNSDACPQTVTVYGFNDLVVSVDLESADPGPFTRCITFELWDCPGGAPTATIDADLVFTNGSAPNVLLATDLPCGSYTCITAKDRLHTLRMTDDSFTVVGTQFVADFTGEDELIGGDLNDDCWIDILDFGGFIGQWSWIVDPNTPCGTLGPHADINGDGVVDTADFTYIQIHFLESCEADCCTSPEGGPDFGGAATERAQDGPITRISVNELKRRGLSHLVVADLNHDGWVDRIDMIAFMGGVRP